MRDKRLVYYLYNLDLFISVISLVLLIILTFIGVILRYLFGQPIVWADEVQMILIVWLSCFGASAAFRFKGHIAIDMVVELFSKRIQIYATIVIFLISFVVLAYLGVNAFEYVIQQYQNQRITEILSIRREFVYAPLPISTLLMIINMAVVTRNELRDSRKQNDGGVE